MSAITRADIADIEQLNIDGSSIEEIRSLTGRSQEMVASVIRGQHILQTDTKPETKQELLIKSRKAIVAIVGEKAKTHIGRNNSFLPTPEQIEAACQAIRETWSDSERYCRHES